MNEKNLPRAGFEPVTVHCCNENEELMQTQHYDGDYGSFSNMCSGFSKPQKPSPSKNASIAEAES